MMTEGIEGDTKARKREMSNCARGTYPMYRYLAARAQKKNLPRIHVHLRKGHAWDVPGKLGHSLGPWDIPWPNRDMELDINSTNGTWKGHSLGP